MHSLALSQSRAYRDDPINVTAADGMLANATHSAQTVPNRNSKPNSIHNSNLNRNRNPYPKPNVSPNIIVQ